MREGVPGEPKLHIPEVKPEDRVPLEQFNNQLDQVLLLINYIQMRTHIFELIDELEIMTEKLADITLGLERNSMHGTP